MKKQLIRFCLPVLAAATLSLTLPSQPGKSNKTNKGNSGQQKDNKGNGNAKNQGQVKPQKSSNGNSGDHGNSMKDDHISQGQGKASNANHGQGNGNHNGDEGMNNMKDNMRTGKYRNNYASYGYDWDRENFKNRDKIRSNKKVTICHKFNQGNEPGVTISVSENAIKAHMAHGDVMGDCPQVNNSVFSDVFLRNRNDYYNQLENNRDQVYYSQSILDYSLQRLAQSRLQLTTMQNNNLPLADIQRKQAVVTGLEQNVSLLETAISVAAGYLANRFL